MNIITHFLFSWSFSEILNLEDRDKKILTIGGVLPDIDGFGIVPDLIFRTFKSYDYAFYGTYHHNLLHSIFGAFLISLFLTFFSKSKTKIFLLSFLIIHLHLFMDLIGSRGPTPDEIWAISYLAPFSNSFQIVWKKQWQLNDIKNIIFTIFLIFFAFYRSLKFGSSPLMVFSKKANEVFVETVKNRFKKFYKNNNKC